jgi:hypothetical protein
LLKSSSQEIGLAATIQFAFEIWKFGKPGLVNGADVKYDAAPPPIVVHRVADDLHQESAWMPNFLLLPARFNNLQCHLLCQVIVVYRRTCTLSHQSNEHSNFGRIDVHVTKLREVRLYLA